MKKKQKETEGISKTADEKPIADFKACLRNRTSAAENQCKNLKQKRRYKLMAYKPKRKNYMMSKSDYSKFKKR